MVEQHKILNNFLARGNDNYPRKEIGSVCWKTYNLTCKKIHIIYVYLNFMQNLESS